MRDCHPLLDTALKILCCLLLLHHIPVTSFHLFSLQCRRGLLLITHFTLSSHGHTGGSRCASCIGERAGQRQSGIASTLYVPVSPLTSARQPNPPTTWKSLFLLPSLLLSHLAVSSSLCHHTQPSGHGWHQSLQPADPFPLVHV